MASGRADEAVLHLERSLAIRGDGAGRPDDRAEAMFGLARALADGDPERSRELAGHAWSIYGEMHNRERELERIVAFLATAP